MVSVDVKHHVYSLSYSLKYFKRVQKYLQGAGFMHMGFYASSLQAVEAAAKLVLE